jgi:uncharacterized membrane protein YraQ (UPF0718 family)
MSIFKKMQKMMNALKKTIRAFYMMTPILLGVVLLIGLFQTALDDEQLVALFSGNAFTDSFVGAVIGSIAPGNPITSYILGGEMLELGIGITAVVAFIVAWVTVGIVQFPAEALMLGKRFSLLRNFSSFVSAILIGVLTGLILQII